MTPLVFKDVRLSLLTCWLTFDGLVVAFCEELHGFGGAQRRAQESLPVDVFPELSQNVLIRLLHLRQPVCVCRSIAGLFFFAQTVVLTIDVDVCVFVEDSAHHSSCVCQLGGRRFETLSTSGQLLSQASLFISLIMVSLGYCVTAFYSVQELIVCE